jgi:hypothetical protein
MRQRGLFYETLSFEILHLHLPRRNKPMQFSSPRRLMLPNVADELWLVEMASPKS